VQAEVREGVLQERPHGVGPEATAAVGHIPDHDAEARPAVAPVDAVQAAGADEDAVVVDDAEDDLGGGAQQGVEPALLLGEGHGLDPGQATAHLGVVEPADHRREIGPLQRPQPHPLALQHAAPAFRRTASGLARPVSRGHRVAVPVIAGASPCRREPT
jgi:hypothetical protein